MPKAEDIGAATANGIKGATLNVVVTNMPGAGGPQVNPFGRTGL